MRYISTRGQAAPRGFADVRERTYYRVVGLTGADAALAAGAIATLGAQSPVTVFEGGRIIVGDGKVLESILIKPATA